MAGAHGSDDDKMTTSLRARIAALSEAEPELAEHVNLRGVLIGVLGGADVTGAMPVIPAERVRAKLARGVPLLDGEAIAVPGSLLPLFDRLAVAWLTDPGLGPSVEELLTAVRGGRLSVEQVLNEALAGHDDHLESLAAGVSGAAALLDTLADLAVRPLLVDLAARLRPALGLGAWDRGYCPVCGAWPIFGEGGGVDARLRCGRCLTVWPVQAWRCPYEAEGALNLVETMSTVDAGQWSVQGCDTCWRYVKVADALQADRLGDILLADLATWRLDRVALERGLRMSDEPGFRLELLGLDDGADDDGFDDA